jgi:hypothetical protein
VSTLQRYYTENSKHIFPEKELRGHSPNSYIHVSVSDLHIPTRSVCLFCCKKIGGPIVGIYKSLTDTWMCKLGLRLRSSFSGSTQIEISLQCIGKSANTWSAHEDPLGTQLNSSPKVPRGWQESPRPHRPNRRPHRPLARSCAMKKFRGGRHGKVVIKMWTANRSESEVPLLTAGCTRKSVRTTCV